jgi:hypothetical protein
MSKISVIFPLDFCDLMQDYHKDNILIINVPKILADYINF